jgi:uncharacterized protein (TIGR01777 family)
MAKNILITGASGLVGTRLTELLLQKQYQVSHLGRNRKHGKIPSFQWNVESGQMDEDAFNGIDAIIHLAGAGVADKRWTQARKKEILESRTKSTALLFEKLKTKTHAVKTMVCASAIGYYGFGESDEILTEQNLPGSDFLAQVTKHWEEEADKISNLGIRVVKLRIGIVLSDKGGALTQMTTPVKWGVGASLGSGKQWISWIHLDDLCNMFIKAVEDEKLAGPFNATGINFCTNQELTKAIAKVLAKPLWLPPVPGFVLKIILGEMADMVLNGSKVSSQKIQQTGFVHQFKNLEEAVADLLRKKN